MVIYESPHVNLVQSGLHGDLRISPSTLGVLEPRLDVAIPPDQPPCRSLRSDANFTRVTASCLRSFRHPRLPVAMPPDQPPL